MRCYYQVLNISREAEDEEIKKAYRKLSLKWHPDKNIDNHQEATKNFQEILEAYKTLSVPQERAWYDSHREQILSGKDDFVEECINVFGYFSPSCYSGYDDGPNSFYTLYAKLFKDLASEEIGSDIRTSKKLEDHSSIFPPFGNSTSDYETVVKLFYSKWSAFSTRKNYTWVEKYDTREADCRDYRRAMEYENKKLRDMAKKERNSQIQQLVKFVKMRDKRVQAEKRRLANIAAEQDKRMAEKIKTKKKLEADKLKEIWEAESKNNGSIQSRMFSEFDEELKKLEEYLDYFDLDEIDLDKIDSEDVSQPSAASAFDPCPGKMQETEEDVYKCILCRKSFLSEGLLRNHNNSRAHKKKEEEYNQANGISSTIKGKSSKPKSLITEPDAKLRENSDDVEKKSSILSCLVCSQNFTSRTTLFEHIKQSGHAAPKMNVITHEKKLKNYRKKN